MPRRCAHAAPLAATAVLLFLLGGAVAASPAVATVPGSTAPQDSAAACPADDSSCRASQQKFVPTTEWQELASGQVAPPDCDVRIDLKSGKEYARLKPPPAQQGITEEEPAEDDDVVSAEERQAAAAAKMYEILMGLPEPPQELESEKIAPLSPDELRELIKKLWNRRQEFLREVYEEVETEQEILEGNLNMLRMLNSPDNNAEIVEILEEVEYLVSNIDNARTVANLDGWKPIVALLEGNATSRHETDDEVVRMAAWTVGTAVKMDEQVQEAALDAGIMAALTARLHESGPFEQSMAAKTKLFFAIGNLLRGNKRAQRIFYANRGFDTIRLALADTGSDEVHQKQNAKLFALVQDLLTEGDASIPAIQAELRGASWCGPVAGATAAATVTQTRELGLQTMIALLSHTEDQCKSEFFSDSKRATWAEWVEEWKTMATEHGDELLDLVYDLLDRAPR